MRSTLAAKKTRRNKINLRRWVQQSVGIVISILCLAIIFHRINLKQLEKVIIQFHWQFLAIGLCSLAFDYFMRIQRWAIMLRAAGAHVSTRVCAAPFLSSIALNNVLPFRAGDIVRAFIFPTAMGVPKITATASLLIERLVDLLTLLICFGIGLALCPINLPAWMRHAAAAFAIIGGGMLMLVIIFSPHIRNLLAKIKSKPKVKNHLKLCRALDLGCDFLVKLTAMSHLQILLKLFFISIFIWAGESGFFLAMLIGLNLHATVPIAILVMAIATLSTLVPSSPGYVGPFHLAVFSVVSLLGNNPEQAASFAVLAHLGLWLPTTLAGAVAMLSNPRLFRGRLNIEDNNVAINN